MSFLRRIASRALGDTAGLLLPKDAGVGAMRAPEVEEVPEDAPAARLASRLAAPVARVSASSGPEEDEQVPISPMRRVARAAEEDATPDPAVDRLAWREAVGGPAPLESDFEEDEPDSEIPRSVRRDDAAATVDEQPDEFPEQTRDLQMPGRVQARRAGRAAALPAGASANVGGAPIGADPGATVLAPGPDGNAAWDDARFEAPDSGSFIDAGMTGAPSWAGDLGTPYLGTTEPKAPDSSVVIEQIDVFVSEPAPAQPSRPRLSDPSVDIAARYLRTL